MKVNIKIPVCLVLIVFSGVELGCKTFSRMLARGGTEFRIEVETSKDDKKAVVQTAIKVTQNKLDAVGLPGDSIEDPDNPNGFIVKLYGSQDLEVARKFLFTTYQLELKKVVSPPNPSPVQTYPTAEAAQLIATSEQEVLEYGERIGRTGQFVIVDKNVIVNGDNIRDAQAIPRSDSRYDYLISFSLRPQGAAKFGDWTGKNINNYLAVVLDNKVQSIAYIKSQIFDSGQIDGRFTKETAEDIAMSLKSGYLPATLRIMDEKQIPK